MALRDTQRVIGLSPHSTAAAGVAPPVAAPDSCQLYFERDTNELRVSADGQAWSAITSGAQVTLPEGMSGAELVSALQNAATDTGTEARRVIIPPALYTISQPIVLARSGVGNFLIGLEIVGAVPAFPGGTSHVRIRSSYNDGPVIAVQGSRGVLLKQLELLGQNNYRAAFPTIDSVANDAAMLVGGVRNNRYSPHCGVAWDPFINGSPGGVDANRYPALTAYYVANYYNTSGGQNWLDNVVLSDFPVGLVNVPSGAVISGDGLKMNRCYFYGCRIGYANGNAQNKECVLEDTDFFLGLHRIDCVTYGAQQGSSVEDRGGGAGWTQAAYNMHHAFGVLGMSGNFFSEALHGLGQFGFGSTSGAVTVEGHGREINLWRSLSTASIDLHAASFRPLVISGCSFGMQDSNGVQAGTYRWHNTADYWLVFDSCQFLVPAVNGHLQLDFAAPTRVEMRRCQNGLGAVHGVGSVAEVQVGGGPTDITFLAQGQAQFTIAGAGAALDVGDHVRMGNQYAPRQYAPSGVPFNTGLSIGTVIAKAGDTITLGQVPVTVQATLPRNETVFRRRITFA